MSVIFVLPHNQRRIPGNPGRNENERHTIWWENHFNGGIPSCTADGVRCKIGDELSAAALTRGLGAPVKRTNVCQIGFHIQDMIAVLLCALCFALFLMGQYFAF